MILCKQSGPLCQNNYPFWFAYSIPTHPSLCPSEVTLYPSIHYEWTFCPQTLNCCHELMMDDQQCHKVLITHGTCRTIIPMD